MVYLERGKTSIFFPFSVYLFNVKKSIIADYRTGRTVFDGFSRFFRHASLLKRITTMHKRRDVLKMSAAAALGLAVGSVRSAVHASEPKIFTYPGSATLWAEQLGWKLGCQVYSFNRFTFDEAVKKNAQTGCRFFEAFPGQKLTKDGGNVGPGMNKEQKKTFRSILNDNGCVCTTFGVAGSGRAEFEFCAEMGIGVLNTEPGFDKLQEVSQLCEEYGVRAALHNHPKPSIYWDYKTVLEKLKDCSPMVGACADTGHYMRSDINPMEAIKALKGRIVGFHFKDLNKYGAGAHDVPWGTGQANVAEILKELADQKFKGCFSAEYEHNWDNNVPEITESVKFFDKTAKEILLG